MKEGHSQRWQEGGVALQDEGKRHEDGGDGDDGEVRAKFRVLPDDGDAALPCFDIDAEVRGGNDHEDERGQCHHRCEHRSGRDI